MPAVPGMERDHLLEAASAVVLAVATVMTAWSTYQATVWGGDEARLYFEASAAQDRAADLRSQATQKQSLHASLFVEYAAAVAVDQAALATFLLHRFPPELRVATDEWLALRPLSDPTAPTTPFALSSYRLAEIAAAGETARHAQQRFDSARQVATHADGYVRLTVVFALVMFFAGVTGKFRWSLIDAVTLAISALLLAAGVGLLLRMPVQ